MGKLMNTLSNNLQLVRYLTYNLELPYSFNNIAFQANDTVSSDLINLKLSHLYDNFIYLYQASLISSNVIPVSSTGVAGITANSTDFKWHKNAYTSTFIPLSSNNRFIGLDKTDLLFLIKNEDIDQYSILMSCISSIAVFNFDESASYFTRNFALNEVDPGLGTYYQCITAFESIDQNLFVLDSSLNKIVKYDASGLYTNDIITRNSLRYLNSIGNFGPSTSKLEFNSPTGLTSYDKNLYVLDSGNKCVKMYDSNLNWLGTYRLSIDLADLRPVDIAADNLGNIFVLTDKNFIKYDNTFQSKQIFDTASTYPGEIFKKIVFSKYNKDIFYLISNLNVYKKFASTPSDLIGKYLLYLFNYNLPNDIITGFSSVATDTGDRNVIFTLNGNTGKLGNFFDNLNLYDILRIRHFDIYNLDQIKLNSEEYFQNWVFNKAISKLLINHMRFRDQIIGKFIGSQDGQGNIVFEGTRYLLPDELDSIIFQQDLAFYIGANELTTTSVFNRIIKKIYDVQVALRSILEAEVTNNPGTSNTVYIS